MAKFFYTERIMAADDVPRLPCFVGRSHSLEAEDMVSATRRNLASARNFKWNHTYTSPRKPLVAAERQTDRRWL